MAKPPLDLWTLVRGRPQIDPNDLADAVAAQAGEEPLDYRTKLLIRDSMDALKSYWGKPRVERWLSHSDSRIKIEYLWQEPHEKVGFPSIVRRLMDKTKPDVIRQFLEHLGKFLHRPVRIYIAGSVALILPGLLDRHTEDIDIVDEVPEIFRTNHALLQTLQDSYGLQLGHVQSHYFPSGWRDRAHSLAPFGRLEVFLLDVYDVFLSKLFSARLKDMEDLRMLAPDLDREALTDKLKRHCQSFLTAPRLKEIAEKNWNILFGEDLPS